MAYSGFWIIYFFLFSTFTSDPEHSFAVYSLSECEGCTPADCLVTAEPRNLPGEIDMGIVWRFYFRYVLFVYSIFFLTGFLATFLHYCTQKDWIIIPSFPIYVLNLVHKLAVTIWGFGIWMYPGFVVKGKWKEECEAMNG